MAQPKKFMIAFSGLNSDGGFLEQALKKFFSPSQFEILYSAPSQQAFDDMRRLLQDAKARSRYKLKLHSRFEYAEIRTLFSFLQFPDAHCAVYVETGHSPDSLGEGVARHFEARTILLEAIGERSRDPLEWNVVPHFSTFAMPYLGEGGATREQYERGRKIVLRGVIEGWQCNSWRYDGILRTMKLAKRTI